MNKGKRRIVQAAVGGKKAPGARKPRKPKKDIWQFPKKYSYYPPKDELPHDQGGVTWKQALFVDAYVDNGGNATQAYLIADPRVTWSSAKTLAWRLLQIEHVIDAIAAKREDIRRRLDLPREKLLRIQAAMATAKLSEFSEVLRDPANKDAYRHLGDSEWALQSADKSYEQGNKIKLYDRQTALDSLWTKLGYEKGTDPGAERDVTGTVLQAALEVLGRSTGDGSK